MTSTIHPTIHPTILSMPRETEDLRVILSETLREAECRRSAVDATGVDAGAAEALSRWPEGGL